MKNLPANAGVTNSVIQSLGQEDALEKELATQSNILSWKILWTEEPGKLESMGLQKVQT